MPPKLSADNTIYNKLFILSMYLMFAQGITPYKVMKLKLNNKIICLKIS